MIAGHGDKYHDCDCRYLLVELRIESENERWILDELVRGEYAVEVVAGSEVQRGSDYDCNHVGLFPYQTGFCGVLSVEDHGFDPHGCNAERQTVYLVYNQAEQL